MRRGGGAHTEKLLLITGVALLVTALAYLSYAYTRDVVTDHQWTMLETVVAAEVADGVVWREERATEARRLADAPRHVRAIAERLAVPGAESGRAWAAFEHEVNTLLARPHYGNVFIVDAAGVPRMEFGEAVRGAERLPGATEAVRRSAHVGFHDVVFTGSDGEPDARLVMLAPVYDGARFVGALGFQLLPALDISPRLSGWPMLGDTAEVLLVDLQPGRLLYLSERRFAEGASGVGEDAPERIATQARTARGRLRGLDYTGAMSLAVAAPIPDTPWTIIAKVHKRENTALVLRFAGGVLLFSLALFAATGTALWAWRRRVAAEQSAREWRAEADRCALAQHFDYLARYANDIIVLADEEGRICECNDKAAEAYGYSRADLLRMSIADLQAPAERDKVAATLEQLAAGAAARFETVHRRSDGSLFPVEVSARVIDSQGRRYYQEVTRDVSERKQSEEHIRRLNRLYAMLVQTNTAIVHRRDRYDLLMQACRIAVQTAGFDAAWVARPGDERAQMEVVAFHGEGDNGSPPPEVLRIAAALIARGVSNGESAYSNDITADAPDHGRDAPNTRGRHGSLAVFRLRVRGEVGPVLVIHAHARGAFDPEMIEMFEEMAGDLGYALENIAHEERRRAIEREVWVNEMRFEAIFENMASAVLVLANHAGEFRIKAVNGAAERMEGLSRAHVEGMEVEAVFPWAPHCLAPVAAAVWASGKPQRIPPHYHQGETLRWRESYVYRLPTDEIVVLMDDVTERLTAIDALRRSEERLQLVLAGTDDGYWDVDLEEGATFYSDRLASLLGCSRELLGSDFRVWEQYVHPDDLPEVRAALEKHLRGDTPLFRAEARVNCGDGRVIWGLARGRVVRRGPEGKPLRVAGVLSDVTARRHAEEQSRLWATVAEVSDEAVLVTDAQRRTLVANPAYTRMTGFAPDELLGRVPEVLEEGAADGRHSPLWEALRRVGRWRGEVIGRRKDGTTFPMAFTLSAVTNDTGLPRHYVIVASDISGRRQAEERARHLAYHDALTGLPSRALFNDRVASAITHARRTGTVFAVLCVDLDRFGNINDALGLALGDRLLVEVADRLRRAVRQDDTVSRSGADDFLVLLPTLVTPDGAARVAAKLMASLAEAFLLDGTEIRLTASVGIALWPGDGETAEQLVESAAAALRLAKRRGHGNVQFCAEEVNQRVRERLSLENRLRRAVERREFELHYQPQIRAHNHEVTGVEALLRWSCDGRLLAPAEFLSLAEETGLIAPIGQWVLEEACHQQRTWMLAGLPPLRVAVNVSPGQLRGADWPRYAREVLERACTEPGALEAEFTEDDLLGDVEAGMAALREMKAAGLSIAVGRFGGGYASLNWLRQLPIDTLKLDKSLVQGFARDPDARAAPDTIIGLARRLGMRIVAEGVENDGDVASLEVCGCDAMQGFHFAPPLAADAFTAWWRARG